MSHCVQQRKMVSWNVFSEADSTYPGSILERMYTFSIFLEAIVFFLPVLTSIVAFLRDASGIRLPVSKLCRKHTSSPPELSTYLQFSSAFFCHFFLKSCRTINYPSTGIRYQLTCAELQSVKHQCCSAGLDVTQQIHLSTVMKKRNVFNNQEDVSQYKYSMYSTVVKLITTVEFLYGFSLWIWKKIANFWNK